jgi:hypothetical protein
MASYATLDNVDAILKEYTEGTAREELITVQAPALGIFRKDTSFAGRSMPLPFEYAPIAGVSPLFSAAQASKNDAYEEAWDIVTDDMFVLWSLDHKAMHMTRTDKGAFINLVEARAKSAMLAFKKVMAHAAYGNGGGMLAEIEANDAAGELTLIPNGSMRIFDRGMYMQPSLTDGTGVGAVINDIQQIATVNRNFRTITAVSGDFPIANYAVGSFVFLRGGFGRYVSGISAWVTDEVPTATEHFGVNRLLDSRLYGVIFEPNIAEDLNAEEGLITLGERVHEMGGEPDLILCHPAFKTSLLKILNTKTDYDRGTVPASGESEAKISYKSIVLALDSGDCDLVTDYNCPRNRVYLLQKDTWVWISAGEMPMRLKYGDDDKNYARHGTENAMEARLGAYMQLACTFPGANGVMLVPDEWLASLPEAA